jgi:hypothetical protein
MTFRELLALPASARETVLDVVLEHHPELRPSDD